MKKLLHERLREYADSDSMSFISSGHDVALWSEEAQALADEIERYYIPRPRFEDGEPVNTGDETDRGTAWVIAVFGDGDWHVHTIDGTILKSEDYGSVLKRPSPKVLDVDGVPIKEGENRYSTRTGEYLAVNEVGTEYCLCTVLGNECTLGTCSYKPSELSSKEPDSLKKLLNDLEHKYGRSSAWVKRLSALIERGA